MEIKEKVENPVIKKEINDTNVYKSQQLPELLKVYYRHLFPHKLFYRWLSYGNGKLNTNLLAKRRFFNLFNLASCFFYFLVDKKYFPNRELSFTLPGDVYVRYLSFNDCNEMKTAIINRCPEKIDIGAVFNHQPKNSKNMPGFMAQERELVFDIDMTDYDDVRYCCSGANICPHCWKFMIIAAKVLDQALREDFGFRHLLWVYSGRRGIHCWVADERARKLTSEGRSAIAEYLSLIEGGEFKAKKVNFTKILHPSVERAIKIIDNFFVEVMMHRQDTLGTPDRIRLIADLCNDLRFRKEVKEALIERKMDFKNSEERWEFILQQVEIYLKSPNKKIHHYIEEVKVQLCYPRLDINVTKGLNHLLKAPFSIHPKTGRVCVPIDIKNIEKFDPFAVPNIQALCQEIDKQNFGTTGDFQDKNLAEKTSLSSAIRVFEVFVKNLEVDFKGLFIKKSDETMEF